MSHEILTGVLRDELGFKGLIVTDALDMGGATATYPPNVAPVQAILAGADQLLIPPQMDTAYGAVLDAVRDGTISQQRLDASVYRVLLHKYQRGIFADPMVDPATAPTIMGAPEHLARAQAITDRTTTLVKNDAGLLPLTAGPRKVLVAGWGAGTTQGIANAFAARGATTQVLVETATTPTTAEIDAAVAAAQDKDLVVVSTNNAYAVNATNGEADRGRRGADRRWCGHSSRPGSRSWSPRCATPTTSPRSPRHRPCSTPTATPHTRSSRWRGCSSVR